MKKLVIVSVPYKPFMGVIKDGCTLPNVEFLIIERKKHFTWKILFLHKMKESPVAADAYNKLCVLGKIFKNTES